MSVQDVRRAAAGRRIIVIVSPCLLCRGGRCLKHEAESSIGERYEVFMAHALKMVVGRATL